MQDLLSNETFLSFLATIATAIWTWTKGEELFQNWKYRRIDKVRDIFEAAVSHVYNVYYREAKKALPVDASLEERNRAKAKARALAVAEAKRIASQEGFDLVKLVGHDVFDAFIEKAVENLKKGY
jgi:hypothetical protein